VTPKDRNAATAPSNHSPEFFLDEAAIPLAVRAMTATAVDYLTK
jgi:amidohydrolase